MDLTQEQKTVIYDYIQNDATLRALYIDSGFTTIADALNASSGSWIVWKTSVTWDEIMRNGMDWTRVDNLTVGKARIWEFMFKNAENSINPSKANIRAGINASWVGTSADLAVRANVYTHCKRPATIVEKLLSTGAGTTAEPATLVVEGAISYWDIQTLVQ